MTWITQEIEELVEKSKEKVASELNMSPSELDSPVVIASKEEFHEAIIDEIRQLHYSQENIQKIRENYLPFVIGKYFWTNKQIWLLHGKGDNMDTIIHELLHSIQRCKPNREGIIDYLTYRITGNLEFIDQYELADWQEIERASSYSAIKKRMLLDGDCEDF